MCDLMVIEHEVLNCRRLSLWQCFSSFLLMITIFAVFLTEAYAAQANAISSGTGSAVSNVSIGADHGFMLSKNEKIYIQIDRAKIVRLPTETRTVVIGNPMVADISTLRDGMSVLTAKGYGTTNLIILDEKGDLILEALVGVIASEDIVIVQRGLERESYTCSPTCQPLIQLGDGKDFFGLNSQQFTSRKDLATAK